MNKIINNPMEKNITQLAKEYKLKLKDFKQLLLSLNILYQDGKKVAPNPQAIERGIIIEYYFGNEQHSKPYYKYDDGLINKYISNDQHLDIYLKPTNRVFLPVVYVPNNNDLPF